MEDLPGESPLAGLRRRLEARRPLLLDDAIAEGGNSSGGGGDAAGGAAAADSSAAPAAGGGGWRSHDAQQHLPQQQHNHGAGAADAAAAATATATTAAATATAGDLLLADPVSYAGACRAAPFDADLERRLFLRFAQRASCFGCLPPVGAGAVAPSPARAAADRARRAPEEELGLYVAPQPRVSDASLYKMEQRLACGAPVAAGAAALAARWWFGASGLMAHEPDPLKAAPERPPRRFDQDLPAVAAVFAPAAVHAGGRAREGAGFRLDVAAPRVEFLVHPAMALEHRLVRLGCCCGCVWVVEEGRLQEAPVLVESRSACLNCHRQLQTHHAQTHLLAQAAQLLGTYREFKRRQAVRLASLYGRRQAALEDALLRAREALFAAQEPPRKGSSSGSGSGGDGSSSSQAGAAASTASTAAAAASSSPEALARLAAACAALERDAAEARQLREEEEVLLAATAEAMRRDWARLVEVRAAQGAALTDVHMRLVRAPAADDTPVQQDGLTRAALDAALAVAEAEAIAGLPEWPAALAAAEEEAEAESGAVIEGDQQQEQQALTVGFRLRRVESMCSAHAAAVAEASARLAVIRGRPSFDPADPEAAALERRLRLLGPAPRRVARLSGEAEAAARSRADAVANRPAFSLEPVLTVGGGAAFSSSCSATATATATGSGALVGSTGGSGGSPPRVRGPRPPAALRRRQYYTRLVINGRAVGASRVEAMRDDFTVEFSDVFRWEWWFCDAAK